MPKQSSSPRSNAKSGQPKRMDFSTLISQLGEKHRQNLDKLLAAYQVKFGPAAADRWRRLACLLMTLAPTTPKISGMQTIQFFVPDGKYKKQVMALHAPDDGVIGVYAANILKDVIKAGLLAKPRSADGENIYRIPNSTETLTIDSLDGNTPNPSAFYKDMTGWNRTAICITLPPTASDAQVKVAEQICTMASAGWPPPGPAPILPNRGGSGRATATAAA